MAKTDRVIRFEEVIVMLNVFSNNFFHQLVELLPAFLQIMPILESNPDIVILANKELRNPELLRVLGLDERKLNFVFVPRDVARTFFFAKVGYFPLVPPCHYSPGVIWTTIRHNFFSHVAPFISGRPLDLQRPLDKLSIIFLNRVGKERTLEDQDALRGLIQREIKPAELTVYTGEPLHEAVHRFHRAHILLGVHGAGLSNMVFMSSQSVVVEIQPDDYTNYCFYNLAREIQLSHVFVSGNGTKTTATSVNHSDVIKGLKKAVTILRARSRALDSEL